MSYAFGPSGGVGGTAYSAPMPTSGGPWKISGVQGRSGSRIDQIEIVWSSQTGGTQSSAQFGGGGGDPFQFPISTGDYLIQITGSVGSHDGSVRLFSLQFVTKSGTKSVVYGKAGPGNFNYQCPPGYQITGIFGRSKTAVDALGVYIDPI
jgi:hypothetical protein